jgi:beta-1,4-mannosyl-glycoprotein beta-1,4-N-acetylglucosaminyltransferase
VQNVCDSEPYWNRETSVNNCETNMLGVSSIMGRMKCEAEGDDDEGEEVVENYNLEDLTNQCQRYEEQIVELHSVIAELSRKLEVEQDDIIHEETETSGGDFDEANDNDWIIYSDSDEIPDLSKINLRNTNKKIVLFKQKFFYYKFNLILESQDWFGSKACKFGALKSFTDLRNTKTKKYKWWRLDTIFKNDKFINLQIVDDGGWHFTELKNPKQIYIKHKNDEHHDEFDLTGINENDIEDMVKNRYIPYDHSADKKDLNKKWNKSNRVYLNKINDNKLPNYLIDNKSKYLKWFV